MLEKGLYEQLINKKLKDALDNVPGLQTGIEAVDSAEAARVLSHYLREVVENGLRRISPDERILLARDIVEAVHARTRDQEDLMRTVDAPPRQLIHISEKDPWGRNNTPPRPTTSLAASSLFTGARHEPDLSLEFQKEIQSADRIDFLVSFIKFSGYRLLRAPLRAFTERGGKLRVITTSYMGATDVRAIEELAKMPNTEIRVSYDTKRTRLHAKAYIFYRNTGFSTAYIGSSNLSNPAISRDWNGM